MTKTLHQTLISFGKTSTVEAQIWSWATHRAAITEKWGSQIIHIKKLLPCRARFDLLGMLSRSTFSFLSFTQRITSVNRVVWLLATKFQ